jgi:large subunit ribosomal protein L10
MWLPEVRIEGWEFTRIEGVMMQSPKQIKEQKVSRFQAEVAESKAMVLAEYKGLTVKDLEDLRRKLRDAGAHLRVVKNTLAGVAFHNLGIDSLDPDLGGQVAFVLSTKDAVTGTKVASDFAKANTLFVLRSGWFDGRKLTLDDIKALAALPSRDELRARFIGTLIAPLNDFILTFQAPLQELIGTLDAKIAKMEAEAPVAAVS